MKENLTKIELERYYRTISYTNKFSPEELINYENDIFGSLDKKQRIHMEYCRLKEYLKNNPQSYTKKLNEIIELENLIKLLNYDTTLIDTIYIKIVSIQIDINQTIRLLSIIPKMKQQLELLDFNRNKRNTYTRKVY